MTLIGLTEKLAAFKGKHYVEEENGIKQDCFSHDLTCNLFLEVLNFVFSISKKCYHGTFYRTNSATSWRK